MATGGASMTVIVPTDPKLQSRLMKAADPFSSSASDSARWLSYVDHCEIAMSTGRSVRRAELVISALFAVKCSIASLRGVASTPIPNAPIVANMAATIRMFIGPPGSTSCVSHGSGSGERYERVGPDELALAITDGQHRTWRRAHDTLGDAAHQEALEAAAPVGAYDDHVDIVPLCVVDDDGRG